MKTFFFTLAAALISFASFANGNKTYSTCTQIPANGSAANGAVQANIFALTQQKVGVVVVQDQNQKMKIEVSDAASNLVFSERLEESSFRQNLNLKQLEKGVYTVTLTTENQCFVKVLDVR